MRIRSYINGEWKAGQADGIEVMHAVNGEPVARIDSTGLDMASALRYGREVGGPNLRAMSIHERALKLKSLAQYLLEKKEDFYTLSACTGATRKDSWIDIEGGIGTLFGFSSIARREMVDQSFALESGPERLSAQGTFTGQHILTPRHGVSVHINAFNFPCWGMLEKIAPSLIAGMPAIVKPATPSAYLTEAMVREIIASGILPEGSLQLICGSVGDLLDHLREQDAVTFTGSASTGRRLRIHPNINNRSIPFNMEADSLNCAILGADAGPGSPEFDLFIKEVTREMTVKCGQKCTAIRRIIVPAEQLDPVTDAISAALERLPVGDPATDGVRVGALIGRTQRDQLWECIKQLGDSCTVRYGGQREFTVVGADAEKGAFFPPTLLCCAEPLREGGPHEIEPFGPVGTLMPYKSTDEAITLAALGCGSLVGSLYTADDEEARRLTMGCAPWHGRLLLINRDCAGESTGHGSPLPSLVHGGPGRAGGGEELGGVRAITHYMQRSALQGSPTTLMHITGEYMPKASRTHGDIHPFRLSFEDLPIGYSVLTHRRTITEADIVHFGCVSGDHFYAHFDEIAARDSLFKQRVAHGYFLISAAAGLFVDPGPGPVLANYGLDNLRFVTPVAIGDTIRVHLTAKRKTKKARRSADEPNCGIVVWDAEITNQRDEIVAGYDVLTLVARKDD